MFHIWQFNLVGTTNDVFKRFKNKVDRTYHSSPFNLWKSLLMLVFVGDLRISVSPKHPTGSKAKRTFCDCSSNTSSSNALSLSLKTSIFLLQELSQFATFAGWHLQNIRPYCDAAALKECHMTETERFVGTTKIRIINVYSVLQIFF